MTGQVEAGTVAVGQTVQLIRGDSVGRPVVVKAIEMFRAIKQTATVGDNVGLVLSKVADSEVGPGDVISG